MSINTKVIIQDILRATLTLSQEKEYDISFMAGLAEVQVSSPLVKMAIQKSADEDYCVELKFKRQDKKLRECWKTFKFQATDEDIENFVDHCCELINRTQQHDCTLAALHGFNEMCRIKDYALERLKCIDAEVLSLTPYFSGSRHKVLFNEFDEISQQNIMVLLDVESLKVSNKSPLGIAQLGISLVHDNSVFGVGMTYDIASKQWSDYPFLAKLQAPSTPSLEVHPSYFSKAKVLLKQLRPIHPVFDNIYLNRALTEQLPCVKRHKI